DEMSHNGRTHSHGRPHVCWNDANVAVSQRVVKRNRAWAPAWATAVPSAALAAHRHACPWGAVIARSVFLRLCECRLTSKKRASHESARELCRILFHHRVLCLEMSPVAEFRFTAGSPVT